MTETQCPDFKVGDSVWLVANNRSHMSGVYTVRAVGRKWITIECANWDTRPNSPRFSRDEYWRHVDGRGYTSPATVYRSKEEAEECAMLSRLWDTLRKQISNRYYRPENVSAHEMRSAAALLGVDLETNDAAV